MKKLLMNKLGIQKKLTLLLILTALLPISVLVFIGMSINIQAYKKNAFEHIFTINKLHKASIEAYFDEHLQAIEIESKNPYLIQTLINYTKNFKQNEFQTDSIMSLKVDPNCYQYLVDFTKAHNFSDLILISSDGDIVFTAANENFGANVIDGSLKESALAKLFAKAKNELAIQDYSIYSSPNNTYAAFIGAPIAHNGSYIGVLAFRFSSDSIQSIISSNIGMGKTGETYLIGSYEGVNSYRSNRKVKSGSVGEPRTDEYIERALSGQEGYDIKKGSEGEEEFIAYSALDIPGLKWAIITTKSSDEVMQPMIKLRIIVAVIILLLIIIIFLVSRYLANKTAYPIVELSLASKQIMKGNFSIKVSEINTEDELDHLIQDFNDMTKKLGTITHELQLAKEKAETFSIEQQNLLSLFDKGDAQLFKWNNDGHWSIDYVSKNVEMLFGYTHEEFMSKKVLYANCIHSEDLPHVFEEVQRAVKENADFFKHDPYRIITKSGAEKWVLDYTATQKNHDNQITHFIGYISDITEQKNIELELELNKLALQELNENLAEKVKKEVENNKEKDHMLYAQSKNAQMGEMISMIAHQWRQPLNAISASAIGLSLKQNMNTLDSEEINKHSIFVQEQTQKMSKIINDFMNFFKPDEQASRFMLKDVLEDIKSLMDAQLKNRNIELHCKEGCNELIFTFQKELEHVLINLIANARDAFENNPQQESYIRISYVVTANKGIIAVEDNAGGIPEDILDKIFNPYFTTKEQGKGTGIGLHMTKRIIEEILKGSIEVKNTDHGAKFTITLPLDSKKQYTF